jgi:ribosome biogenesis GTPase A
MSKYSDLSSSITILQKNDLLLKNKIFTLPHDTKYRTRVLEYFEQSEKVVNSPTCSYTGERVEKVTSMLKYLWEAEFEKGKTFQVFKDFED